MKRTCAYAVARTSDGAYRLSRTSEPSPGPVADIIPVHDRAQTLTGWRLRPRVTMQGAASKVWPKASDDLASTRLMKPGEAKAAIAAADAGDAP